MVGLLEHHLLEGSHFHLKQKERFLLSSRVQFDQLPTLHAHLPDALESEYVQYVQQHLLLCSFSLQSAVTVSETVGLVIQLLLVHFDLHHTLHLIFPIRVVSLFSVMLQLSDG